MWRVCDFGAWCTLKSGVFAGFLRPSAAYAWTMHQIEKRDPRGQGHNGEVSAMLWLAGQEAVVLLPFGHSRDDDLDHRLR
jgi:hypothetical protein